MARHMRRRRWPKVVVGMVLIALIGAGAGAYALGWVDYWRGVEAEKPDPVPPPQVAAITPGERSVTPAEFGAPDRAAVRSALGPILDQDRFGGRVTARVASLQEGADPVLARGDQAATPASTTKLVTATAALHTFGPDATFTTTVTRTRAAGDGPVELTLVGGGDPLLTSDDLTELAEQVAAEVDGPVRLRFDDSLFTGPAVSPRWPDDYVPDEVVAPISALSVDRSRTPGPDDELGTDDDLRAAQPSRRAARQFRTRLERAGLTVTGSIERAHRESGQAEEVAAHAGPALYQIVEHLLQTSDNETTEVVARQVGLAAGDPSFAGSTDAVLAALGDLGIPTDRVRLRDGSGLSRENRIPATVLMRVLQTAADPDHPGLGAVLTGLPVAGFTGTGSGRFLLDAEAGRGYARLKSGTLTGVHSYAGVVEDRNGTPLVLVMLADRVSDTGALEARDALDDAATALATCDCS